MIARLFAQLDLDGREEVPIENGGLLTLQHLTLEVDLSDVETITKEVSERTTRKRDAADFVPGPKFADLADDAPLAELGHQQVKAAKLQVAAEYGSDPLGFSLIDGDLAALGVIAKRYHPSDPEPFPL